MNQIIFQNRNSLTRNHKISSLLMLLHIVLKIEIGVVEVNLTQNIIILLKVKLLLSVMSRVKKIQHKEKDFFVNRIFLTDESRSAKA